MDDDDTDVMPFAQVSDSDDTPPFGGMFDDTDVNVRQETSNEWPPAPREPADTPAPPRRRAAVYRAVKRPDTSS